MKKDGNSPEHARVTYRPADTSSSKQRNRYPSPRVVLRTEPNLDDKRLTSSFNTLNSFGRRSGIIEQKSSGQNSESRISQVKFGNNESGKRSGLMERKYQIMNEYDRRFSSNNSSKNTVNEKTFDEVTSKKLSLAAPFMVFLRKYSQQGKFGEQEIKPATGSSEKQTCYIDPQPTSPSVARELDHNRFMGEHWEFLKSVRERTSAFINSKKISRESSTKNSQTKIGCLQISRDASRASSREGSLKQSFQRIFKGDKLDTAQQAYNHEPRLTSTETQKAKSKISGNIRTTALNKEKIANFKTKKNIQDIIDKYTKQHEAISNASAKPTSSSARAPIQYPISSGSRILASQQVQVPTSKSRDGSLASSRRGESERQALFSKRSLLGSSKQIGPSKISSKERLKTDTGNFDPTKIDIKDKPNHIAKNINFQNVHIQQRTISPEIRKFEKVQSASVEKNIKSSFRSQEISNDINKASFNSVAPNQTSLAQSTQQNKYTLGKIIGEGRFGVVRLVHDLHKPSLVRVLKTYDKKNLLKSKALHTIEVK
jgi:hypothetical protein